MPEPESGASKKKIRLDKWLKLSCLFKTRAAAAKACEAGKVKVNSARVKPAQMLCIGDRVTIKRRSKYHNYEVLDIVYKNVSRKDARLLYKEETVDIPEESKELYELLQEWDRQGKRKYKGRPTKKERRDLDKLKGG